MLIGSRQKRKEDLPLLKGEGRFVPNLSFPDQLHMRVVRSPVAYGKIESIDTTEARLLPGVYEIWTAKDIAEIGPIPLRQTELPGMGVYRQNALATDYVRYVGDPIALVFADDPYIAEDAQQLVFADIDELEPCLDARGKVGEIKPGLPSEAAVIEKGYGDIEAAYAGAHRIVRLQLKVGRHAAVPLETRGALATYDSENDIVRLYGAAKIPHRNRLMLSGILGHPLERLHLHEGHTGGGFGNRGEVYPEDVLTCIAAKRFCRPVKWIEDRRENLIAANHSRQQQHEISAAVDENGFVLGLDCEFWLDQGAYLRTHGGAVTDLTAAMLPGPYVIPAYRCKGHIRLTNKTPCGTYRAPGRYEGTFVRERLMDAISRELGLDPVEVRRTNLIPEDAFPYDRKMSALGTEAVLDSGRYEDLLDRMLEFSQYATLSADVNRRRAGGEMVGVGLAFFVEKSGLGPNENAKFILDADGLVEIVTGTASMGQGVETVLAQIGADASKVPFDALRVTHGQTDRIEHGLGANASRATTMSGSAVYRAGEAFNVALRQAASEILQVPADDLIVSDGEVLSSEEAGGPSITLKQLAAEIQRNGKNAIEASGVHEQDHMGYPYGIHLVVARVDRDTAHTHLERFLVAYDVGRAINPLLIEGQISGAAAQGIGGALLEEFTYDAAGQPLVTSFADYLLPSVFDVPDVELLLREDSPSPMNPLGVKGAGEGGLTAAGAAIAAAIDNAIEGKGAIDEIPVTPGRLHLILKRLAEKSKD